MEYSGQTRWLGEGLPSVFGGIAMFLGTHTPKLDDKGRLILPAKFREPLTGGLVMTKGQERCVIIWPTKQFNTYAESLRARSQNNEKVRAYTRVFFSSAFDDVADKQGRVTIPSSLREWAGLERDLVVVGADTRIEIWDAIAWSQYLDAQEPGFASLDEVIQ
ncbi:MAG: division/cell wall cluster transcriptional repressor MraZ [Actinomycetota bacterium]